MCGLRIQSLYTWPTCVEHYDLTTLYDSFYSWVWKSSYDPHGPVHTWLGGMVDCEETFQGVEDLVGHDIAVALAALSFIHRKGLYREEIWKCQQGVTVDVSESPAEVRVTMYSESALRLSQHIVVIIAYGQCADAEGSFGEQENQTKIVDERVSTV